MVVTAPSMAHAASTALPPLANIKAPAVAPSGLPVIAIQCLACRGGLWVLVCCAKAGPEHQQRAARN